MFLENWGNGTAGTAGWENGTISPNRTEVIIPAHRVTEGE
jgi:hypothetical protein